MKPERLEDIREAHGLNADTVERKNYKENWPLLFMYYQTQGELLDHIGEQEKEIIISDNKCTPCVDDWEARITKVEDRNDELEAALEPLAQGEMIMCKKLLKGGFFAVPDSCEKCDERLCEIRNAREVLGKSK